MDELEIRVAAIETLLIEVLTFVDPMAVSDGLAAIRAGLDTAGDADERAIRLQAVQILEEARDRYKGPLIGLAIRPPRD